MAHKKNYSKDTKLIELAKESKRVAEISGAVLVQIKEEMNQINKRTKENWNKISLLL